MVSSMASRNPTPSRFWMSRRMLALAARLARTVTTFDRKIKIPSDMKLKIMNSKYLTKKFVLTGILMTTEAYSGLGDTGIFEVILPLTLILSHKRNN